MINPEVFISLGRLLVAILFIFGGLYHFFVLSDLSQAVEKRHIPFPRATVTIGSMFEIIAGCAIGFRYHPPIAAVSLIIFTVVSSCMMMNFWSMKGQERTGAIDGWTSNLGVIAALLFIACQP